MPSDTRAEQPEHYSKRSEKKLRSYNFSTIVIVIFLIAMMLVSSLVLLSSYWGARDIIQENIQQLSRQTTVIANLTLEEYLKVNSEVDSLIASSTILMYALRTGDIEQLERMLNEIYQSSQEGRLDLLLVQKGIEGEIYDVSLTVYDLDDLKKQITAIPESTFTNRLVISNQGPRPVYAVMNKKPLLLRATGKVIGYVYSGIVLNDNIEILSPIMANTEANALQLLYKTQAVAQIASQTKDRSAQISSEQDDLVVFAPLAIKTPSPGALVLKITHSQNIIKTLEDKYKRSTYTISGLIIIIILSSIWILNDITRHATSTLNHYAKEIALNKNKAKFKRSRVREFNQIGLTLSQLIKAMTQAENKIIQSNTKLKRLADIASKAKDRLKKSNIELAAANTELEEFAYRTSHDLRSPIVSSISLLSIATEALQQNDIKLASQSLDLAHNSLSKLEVLVKEILILNEIKNKEEEYQAVDAAEIITESLNKFSDLENMRNITVETDFAYKGTLKTKKTKFRAITENLISNAIKYYDPAKKKPYIKISTYKKSGSFILQVKDNGLGIPPEKKEKLFTMFTRLHPKSSFGSGLGLYMAKKSADAINADIRFKSHGDGSIFELEVPLEPIESA